jgi:hypothetical protein
MLIACDMKFAATISPGSFGSAILIFWLAMLGAEAAHASGQLPPTIFMEKTLPNIDACHKLLDSIYQDDLAEAAKPQASADRQQVVLTHKPVVEGPQLVTYDVQYGWLFKTELPRDRKNRNDYSYDRRHYICNAGQLTGTSTQGFTLETYEDMPNDESKGKD